MKQAAEALGCNVKLLINLKYRNGLRYELHIPSQEVHRLSNFIIDGKMIPGNRFTNAKYKNGELKPQRKSWKIKSTNLADVVVDAEKKAFVKILKKFKGDKSKVARFLGVDLSTVYRKVYKHQL
jgi:transcriptional regulator with PAS, ATPase and Fis domain